MVDKLVSMDRSMRITMLISLFLLSIAIMPFIGSFWFIFFILGFVFLGLLIYTNGVYDKRKGQLLEKSLDKALINLDFKADDSYLSDDYLSAIAINESQSKIAILKRNSVNENFTLESFGFSEIIESSIKEDGETITRTNKGSAVGYAAVGGVLAGGVGAIVGGMVSDKQSSEQILKSTLSIVVDDIKNPIHEIDFLNSKMLVDRNSQLYQDIYSDLHKWHKRMSVIIKRNDNSKSV